MPLVLGLDPGSRHTGYGLVEASGRAMTLLACGRLSPPPAWPLARRLVHLHEGLTKIMSGCAPAAVAVESLFTGRNIRSAVVLAQARGVLLLAAAQGGAEIFEYAPREIKNAVTGYGQAGKDQVAFMVAELLNYRQPLPPDAADALAAAICHAGLEGRAALAGPRRGRGGRLARPVGRSPGRPEPGPEPAVITHLRGRLTSKSISSSSLCRAVVESGGLGYELALPLSAYPALPEPPADIFIFTRLFIREESWDLYGFVKHEEREAFAALTSVSRVGPKLALTILSSLAPEELARALLSRDLPRLSAIKGLGTKTAERLLLELKDKAPKLAALCGLSDAAPAEDEVVSGLRGLGYTEAEAQKAARAARGEAESDDLAVILKLALNHLKKA